MVQNIKFQFLGSWLLALGFLISSLSFGQSVQQKLKRATQKFLQSPACYSANLSFFVADERGRLVYEYRGNKGLSTASTQKIFSSAMALEVLGKNYRYTTTASHTGNLNNGVLNGDVVVHSNGDPTLGSWRYEGYKPENFKAQFIQSLKDKGIQKIEGNLVIDDTYFDFQTIPGGYPWDDLGNYYGTGVWSVNWRENQFDMFMKGRSMKGFNINMDKIKWVNEVKVGGKSDKSLVFTAPHSNVALINGTLPKGKKMTVSGSIPNPPYQLALELKEEILKSNIAFSGEIITNSQQKINGKEIIKAPKSNIFFTYQSPTLDKIVYWFLKKSVNLYGETFVKTVGKVKKNKSNYKSSVAYMKSFWKSKGINPYMINFADGSGLSPQNYASARAEVQALLWAKKQPWFNAYYKGFPKQKNGMKMKSGTIRDAKGFAGYHTSKSGKKYVFAIIVNNYQGWSVSKDLFKILNHLK
ncbi:MAG: D-alanyl-D-alanine carboxypeptidase/D-alanyl-D-alanine-endopeptidase [Flavobacteriales bacterium]|nr:MAG: D-alanyl-D-alanine carboxypeptidase/D-alanyl-D-alanine-endopeptidase [Flavobacteriales bacterium]